MSMEEILKEVMAKKKRKQNEFVEEVKSILESCGFITFNRFYDIDLIATKIMQNISNLTLLIVARATEGNVIRTEKYDTLMKRYLEFRNNRELRGITIPCFIFRFIGNRYVFKDIRNLDGLNKRKFHMKNEKTMSKKEFVKFLKELVY